MGQLQKDVSSCASQEKQLRDRQRTTTAHFEPKIAAIVHEQRALTDEKARAVAYKECAHMALDVARADESLRNATLTMQLRKRRAELRRTLTDYLRVERQRLEAAAEYAEAVSVTTAAAAADASSSSSLEEADVAVQEAWTSGQRLLERAEVLLAPDAEIPAASAIVSPTSACESAADKAAAAADGDADGFFSRERAAGRQHQCADCNEEEVPWASVSHGTYICTDCAGRHRG